MRMRVRVGRWAGVLVFILVLAALSRRLAREPVGSNSLGSCIDIAVSRSLGSLSHCAPRSDRPQYPGVWIDYGRNGIFRQA